MDVDFVDRKSLLAHSLAKYGEKSSMGWSPRRRLDFGYTLAGDVYECFLDKLVTSDTRWVDVGGGRSILPHNAKLSQELAERCSLLTSVDPSDNVFDNPYSHEKICSFFEDLKTDRTFNLATFRMVAEHIENPDAIVNKLRECVEPNGLVVIYTINKFCPVPIITRLTPFSWHHKIKKIFWGGEERDTFPVAYKMNSRKDLDALFLGTGEYQSVIFKYLDDVSVTIEHDFLNRLEMFAWKLMNSLGFSYFENNILAVYRKK